MRVHLHLGVHKTATTYLQTKLAANRAILKKAAIAYVPLDEIRSGLTTTLGGASKRLGLGRGGGKLRRALAAWSPPEDGTLVLSDENIIGVCSQMYYRRALYPDARERLTALRKALGDTDVDVFLSLRSYDAFYLAAYSQIIRGNPFRTFAELRERFPPERLSWTSLVDDIAAVFPEERIHVWAYEDFRRREAEFLEKLVGIPADRLTSSSPAEVLPSLSRTAMDALHALGTVLPPEEVQRFVAFVGRTYPKSADHPAFSPWTAEERTELAGRYTRDMAAVMERYPRIDYMSRFADQPR